MPAVAAARDLYYAYTNMNNPLTHQHHSVRLGRLLAGLCLTAAVASCTPPAQPQASAQAAEQLAKIDPSQIPFAEFGQLPVFITSQLTDGRNVQLRGLVLNPYPEPVEGVRLIFRILPTPDAGARELDRFQKVTDDRIPSGGRAALRWDLQTMYAGQGGMSGFTLQAFALKRGGKDLPPPPDARQ